MSKLARFRSKHGAPKRNPPLATDIASYIVPGFAAFVLDRLVSRTAAVQIAKRWPKFAKHASAISAVGTFGAAWFGAHKVKYLEKYHDAIVIGSGLAMLQTLAQLYVPKLHSLLGDPCPTPMRAMASPLARQQISASSAPAPMSTDAIPAGFKPTSAAEWYTYNDSYDAGGYKGKVEIPRAQTQAPPAPDNDEIQLSELLDNSDLNLDNSDLGLS